MTEQNTPNTKEFELYKPQTGSDKFKRLGGDNPFLMVGLAGGIGAVAYMAKQYKVQSQQPNFKTSVYLIHTRMFAQGLVIGTLTLGMCHQIYTKLQDKYSKNEN